MDSPMRSTSVRDVVTLGVGVFIGMFIARVPSVALISRSWWPRGGMVSPESSDGEVDAVIVPAGGQTPDGPPPHVRARIEKAAEIYHAQDRKPFIIATAWGTPHKPCPHDAAGFERHESADNAKALLGLGVAPEHLLEESVSLETVGNALHTRLLHTERQTLGCRFFEPAAGVVHRWVAQ